MVAVFLEFCDPILGRTHTHALAPWLLLKREQTGRKFNFKFIFKTFATHFEQHRNGRLTSLHEWHVSINWPARYMDTIDSLSLIFRYMMSAIEPFSKVITIHEFGGGTVVIAMYANELACNFGRFNFCLKNCQSINKFYSLLFAFK